MVGWYFKRRMVSQAVYPSMCIYMVNIFTSMILADERRLEHLVLSIEY